MIQTTQNQIPVTFVNLFTRRRLGQAVLPSLPSSEDDVYLRGLGYEVAKCEWMLADNGGVEILVIVLPQINENAQRPFSYPEEEEE
ncbi:MAG: hypothetical protein IAF02_02490 [Anaerolineae bacterium]|nr:hypothetical protein [Anaerolineae bacterium]